MTEFEYEVDHVKHSVGGKSGHIFRRIFHVGMAAIPWLYYAHGESISDFVSLSSPAKVAAILGISVFFFEVIRIRFGLLIVGQREYEKHQFSALAWGAMSIALTFVALSPWVGAEGVHAGWLTIPIILALTFGDPAMGEARRMGLEARSVFALGTIVCGITWLACGYFFGTPYWMALLMGPLTTAAEWPKLKWIDDNATMILIPLASVLMLAPFL